MTGTTVGTQPNKPKPREVWAGYIKIRKGDDGFGTEITNQLGEIHVEEIVRKHLQSAIDELNSAGGM